MSQDSHWGARKDQTVSGLEHLEGEPRPGTQEAGAVTSQSARMTQRKVLQGGSEGRKPSRGNGSEPGPFKRPTLVNIPPVIPEGPGTASGVARNLRAGQFFRGSMSLLYQTQCWCRGLLTFRAARLTLAQMRVVEDGWRSYFLWPQEAKKNTPEQRNP